MGWETEIEDCGAGGGGVAGGFLEPEDSLDELTGLTVVQRPTQLRQGSPCCRQLSPPRCPNPHPPRARPVPLLSPGRWWRAVATARCLKAAGRGCGPGNVGARCWDLGPSAANQRAEKACCRLLGIPSIRLLGLASPVNNAGLSRSSAQRRFAARSNGVLLSCAGPSQPACMRASQCCTAERRACTMHALRMHVCSLACGWAGVA